MPIWFYNRPLDKADPTEAKVAEVFNQLPDSWRIRWGYFYERKSSQGLKDREGDFILLGPDGRILVVEVKSGRNRHFALTGEWEHGEDNPALQLNAEWKAVIDALHENFDGKVPYVGKALCLPHVNLTGQDRLRGELGRECLIFGRDLEDFPRWWQTHLACHNTYCPDPVKAFHSALARGMKPESLKLFLKQSDLLFDQFRATEFEILGMLGGNHQWMVEGGVGTGKTFLALKQAEWLAERNGGQRVLFLVYNLLLAARLEKMAGQLKLTRGEVVVRSWEALLGDIIAAEGVVLEIPDDKEAMGRYFIEELPEYVRMALESGRVPAEYDALVVDEAQDHDTAFSTLSDDAQGKGGLGWWSWYFALLKDGASSPVALFYDAAQRPAFRGAEKFDPVRLRQNLSQVVHVKLRKSLRYTMPILSYLRSLNAPGTKHLVEPLEPHEHLPIGPEVAVVRTTGEASAAAIEGIVADWKRKGLCKPSEVTLIGPRKWLRDSSLGGGALLCGFEVADYNEDVLGKVSYIGAHRSKGMDFLAVILIDFDPFDTLAADPEKVDYQEAFFLGASRARQLLGVVEREG